MKHFVTCSYYKGALNAILNFNFVLSFTFTST